MKIEEENLQDPEILKRIQEVEVRVGQMALQAMVDARQVVQQAREQAEHLLKVRRQDWEQTSAVLLQDGIRLAEQEAGLIVEKATQEAQEFKERARVRIEEAADLVLHRVFPGLSRTDTA